MKSFKSKQLTRYIYLMPIIVFIMLSVGLGLLMAIMESLAWSSGFPFSFYEQLFTKNTFVDSLFLSVRTALLSTILSLIIGVLFTRTFIRYFKTDQWKYIVWVPMLIPHFVAAYIIFLLFSQTGWISAVIFQFDVIRDWEEFPIVVNSAAYIGVVMTYVWKEVPFVILMIFPIYQRLDFRYEDVVHTLGGKGWSVWTTVEFPWLWPILLETGLVIFSFILSAFEVPALLGVTYPKMLPVLAYEWFYEGDWSNRPLAQALMVSITILTITSSYLIFRLSHRWRNRLMKGG